MDPRARRLGELLLEQGKIREDQLTQALKAQAARGARIGTNLVELDVLSILDLGRALARQRAVPEALPGDFMAASPRLLNQFPKELAAQLRVFPLRVQSKVLQLAMVDPHDHEQIGEVTFQTGLRVQPMVAPELRMVFFLEQRFSIARPPRFAQAGAERKPPALVLRADDLPPLPPPRPPQGRSPTNPGYPTVPAAAQTPPAPAAAPLSPVSTADLELVYLDDVPREAAPLDDDFEVTIDLTPEPAAAEPPASELQHEGLPAVISALARAADRATIAGLAVRPVLARPALSVLFRIKQGVAHALAAAPSALPLNEVQRLELPLSEGSLLQRALAEGGPVKDPDAGDPLQKLISAYLRAPEAGEVFVLPIVVGQHVASLLCVQLAPGPPCPDDEAAKLVSLAGAVAEAYLRLIRQAKARAGQ